MLSEIDCRNKNKNLTHIEFDVYFVIYIVISINIFNVVNFANLIYMKLYSLLILTENTKKSKNNFKALKKSEIVVFPGRILPCKQNN